LIVAPAEPGALMALEILEYPGLLQLVLFPTGIWFDTHSVVVVVDARRAGTRRAAA
jgi:hypothetical protein